MITVSRRKNSVVEPQSNLFLFLQSLMLLIHSIKILENGMCPA